MKKMRYFLNNNSSYLIILLLIILLCNLFVFAPSNPDETIHNQPFVFTENIGQIMGEHPRNTIRNTERLNGTCLNNLIYDVWLAGQMITDIFYAVFYKNLLLCLVWTTFLSIIILWQQSKDGDKSKTDIIKLFTIKLGGIKIA